MLIDTHCHLDRLKEFEIRQLVDNSKGQGVGMLHSISTRLDMASELRSFSNTFSNIVHSIGIHPEESNTVEEWSEDKITQALIAEISEKTVSLGETGLDYFYGKDTKELQKKVFRSHLAAAKESDLPIVVHVRDAEDDVFELLSSEPGVRGIIHCFTGTEAFAKKCIDLGYLISISGIITFKNADALRTVVKTLPVEQLLVETDAPFLAPVPHRGKTNLPEYVIHVAKFLAEMKEVSLEELATITTQSFLDMCPKAKSYV
jgi:TatD DNase family protein